jgi:hypothetical protein
MVRQATLDSTGVAILIVMAGVGVLILVWLGAIGAALWQQSSRRAQRRWRQWLAARQERIRARRE